MDSQLYRDFARLEDSHWWFRGRRAVIREVLRRTLPAGPLRILDVGCGTGGMLKMLGEFGSVEGLDASEEGLGYCRERVGPALVLHKGVLPSGLPDGRRYDLVTAFDVLEHLEDPVTALSAIRAAVELKGAFVCTVPAYQLLWSDHDIVNHHQRRYTHGLLRQHIEAAGFAFGFHSYFNSVLLPPIALVRLAQRLLPRLAGPGDARSDFSEASPLLNRFLEGLFSAERFVVPRMRLPFGVSLVAVARPR